MASESMGEQYREAERRELRAPPTVHRMATPSPRTRKGPDNRPWSTHRVVAVRSVEAEAPGSSVPRSIRRPTAQAAARRLHHPAPRLSGSAGSPRCSSGWHGSAPGRPARWGTAPAGAPRATRRHPAGSGRGPRSGSVPPMLEPLRAAATTTFDLEADVRGRARLCRHRAAIEASEAGPRCSPWRRPPPAAARRRCRAASIYLGGGTPGAAGLRLRRRPRVDGTVPRRRVRPGRRRGQGA